ncbi:hypothetical protein BGW39_000226 [Mortierella sp. 14UC]|nr:hypothetical protein BGW39_000226 [Mortierella sp. 14UC]
MPPQPPPWPLCLDQFLLNEGSRLLFLSFRSLLQLLIFYFSFEIYNRSTLYSQARSKLGVTLGVSRGAAAAINFDCGLILFSVCRNLISLLRSTFLNSIVPFDKFILFYKTNACGERASRHYGTPTTSSSSSSSHSCTTAPFASSAPTPHPTAKPPPGSYKFVLGSLFFYILERTVREIRACLPTAISKIVLHPSKVLEVQIKKSSNKQGDGFFRAKAGQYVFLDCPDISAFEWHPFTITSAPEEDYVSVHIRIVGDWTTAFAKRLGCSFDDEQQFWIEELRTRSNGASDEAILTGAGMSSGFSSAVAMDSMAFGHPSTDPIISLPRVLLDGPYGSPSEDAFNYEIAVLVGAGIGVTPFASVLKYIWYSVMQPTKIITLRKVYFFWVCRDRDAFEWFQDLLIALEEQNLAGFLEIRSYLMGELGKEEMDTVLM